MSIGNRLRGLTARAGLTGTNLALVFVHTAFVAAAVVACWQSWRGDSEAVNPVAQQVATEPQELIPMVMNLGPPPRFGEIAQHGEAPMGRWRRVTDPAKITLEIDDQKISGLYHSEADGADLTISFV